MHLGAIENSPCLLRFLSFFSKVNGAQKARDSFSLFREFKKVWESSVVHNRKAFSPRTLHQLLQKLSCFYIYSPKWGFHIPEPTCTSLILAKFQQSCHVMHIRRSSAKGYSPSQKNWKKWNFQFCFHCKRILEFDLSLPPLCLGVQCAMGDGMQVCAQKKEFVLQHWLRQKWRLDGARPLATAGVWFVKKNTCFHENDAIKKSTKNVFFLKVAQFKWG